MKKKSYNYPRIILITVVIAGLLFGANYVYENDLINKYVYGGSVSGYAFDAYGDALVGQAFVIGYPDIIDIDPDGSFLIKNISPGEHSLAIGFEGKGVEFPVTIYSKKTTDVGNLTYIYVDY